MRDEGLAAAIQAAGGVSELARRLGISQPSVSNWTKIPAERIASVESVTLIDRSVLRPDLYGASTAQVDEIDTARSQHYALLSTLLIRAPEAALLKRLADMRGDASILGAAIIQLAEAASRIAAKDAEREYFDLFIGLGRGELMPYGSYYLTGFLHERPLARLREDLKTIGLVRSEGNREPEDHAAILCEIMAGLVGGRFGTQPGADETIFEKHIAPWMGRLFTDMQNAKTANFYRSVGAFGRAVIDIEQEAFALPA